jgi:hypothetical protein
MLDILAHCLVACTMYDIHITCYSLQYINLLLSLQRNVSIEGKGLPKE